ncbi:unnamed protein product [Adineta ricciae]|uniref:Uncharacterized protein n=1 Tax=Adineta ricciae TaxID=249248 RepID=A0A814XB12_ADIRI|nr:unnamed protein product [Adineta ricciae]
MASTTNSARLDDHGFSTDQSLNTNSKLVNDVIVIKNHDGFKIGRINDNHPGYYGTVGSGRFLQTSSWKRNSLESAKTVPESRRAVPEPIQISTGPVAAMIDLGTLTRRCHLLALADIEKKKETILNMESMINLLIQKLITMPSSSEIIKILLNDQSFEFDDIVAKIYAHLNQIESEENLENLAQIVAHISIDKNRLPDIGKHLSNVLDHRSNKAKFTRILVDEIENNISRCLAFRPFIIDFFFQSNDSSCESFSNFD